MVYKVSMVKLVIGSFAALGCGLFLWLTILSFGKIDNNEARTESNGTPLKEFNLFEELIKSNTTLSGCNYEPEDLQHIVSAVLRVLAFVEKNVDNLVIDSAIGTRILESQIRLFLLGHPKLPETIEASLQSLGVWSKRLSLSIIDHLKAKEMLPSDRNKFLQNIYWVNDSSLWQSPDIDNWRPTHEPQLILLSNDTIESIASQAELLDEKVSDMCTADIFQKCKVTDHCARMFMETIGSQYSLTHQIFYFHFANMNNCFDDNEFRRKMGNKSLAEIMHQMCNKVWQEAHAIQKSDFPISFRDLLMEQVTVCSLAGYTQLLQVSWLNTMLSWQTKSGCFSLEDAGERTEVNSTKGNSTDNRERVKRDDNVVQMGSDKCSVHFTTTALSAMAMHLRYFGDTCLRNC